MRDYHVYYVGTEKEVAHHGKPFAAALDLKIVSSDRIVELAQPGDVCIFYNEYFPRFRQACTELKQRNCTTLYAIDGILEWRNSWEAQSGLGVMRPVLSHKVATIGRSQTRILESWGNLGKCETVGIPRLDGLHNLQKPDRQSGQTLEILVMTAKTPSFTSEQHVQVEQSLNDLKHWFESHASINGVPVVPRWRLTADLCQAIGVANELKNTTGSDLADVLLTTDAVVTTPSTAMLESMSLGIPVALLDYHNRPHYVPAAWRITAQEHIDTVMRELLDPAEPRMLYQETLLHDALECQSPATDRMVELIESLIRISHDLRAQNQPVAFPRRVLPDEQHGHHLPEAQFDLQQLYPEHACFSNPDLAALQIDLAKSQIEIECQRKQISHLEHRLAERTITQTVAKQLKRLAAPGVRWLRRRPDRTSAGNHSEDNRMAD